MIDDTRVLRGDQSTPLCIVRTAADFSLGGCLYGTSYMRSGWILSVFHSID